MKIEKQENSIRLIPENDWDLKGYLQLNFPSRDWGR